MQTTLNIQAKQSLTLTPHLQQAVKLLQLSSIEFTQAIQQAMTSNPFLEESDEVKAEGVLAPSTNFSGEISLAPTEETPLPAEASNETLPMNGDSMEERSSQDDYAYPLARQHDDEQRDDLGDWYQAMPTLREHLHGGLRAYRLNSRDHAIASIIIEALDDDGYLRQNLDEIFESIEIEPALSESEIRTALLLVQHLEPAGIGARNLSECLQLQLKAQPDSSKKLLALAIVEGHLDQFARHDWDAMKEALACRNDALQEACALIQQLDPRPGLRVGKADTRYVTADVIVRKHKGQWVTMINPAVLPRARLNQVYANMLHQTQTSSHSPMAQQLQEARWLLRNVAHRFITIKRVADAIVRQQRTFFEYGEIALKPMLLRDVAEELGLHESTISRATCNKYMMTPAGLYEFKHFFSRQLATETGGSCSAAAVRALLKEMILSENREAPLSDVSLTRMLAEQGVKVARRTVTKYRCLMKLPQADLRRQF